MPLPRWLAHINKWVFNPMEVRRSHPRCHRQPAPSARVIVGGMTLAVPGATRFVAPAQRAVIKHVRALGTRDRSASPRSCHAPIGADSS
jgi:hypothetical protein